MKIPKFKLSNIVNNISIYNKLTDNYYSDVSRNVKNSNLSFIINNIIINVIKDIQNNPSILIYFNYDIDEYLKIEDIILNGLEYPGVYDDFKTELIRKNEIAINNERKIKRFINKYYFLTCINKARKNNTQVNFN